MRLAIVSPWAISTSAVGGTERFVVDLAESLSELGHYVDVYMFSGITHKANGVDYIALNLFGSGKAIDEFQLEQNLGNFSDGDTYNKLAHQIEARIDANSYDALHINTQLLLRAWPEKRRTFTIHTNPFEFKQAWGEGAYETMLAIAQDQARNGKVTFTAPSAYYSKLFSAALHAKVITIPHAVDMKRLIANQNRDKLIKQYKFDKQKIHLLLPSRLEPMQKQPGLLFDALQFLPAEQLKRIDIIASGIDEQYRAFAQTLSDQAKRVRCAAYFVRFERMADAYAIADIVVLPSQSESFGYSALESLSLGIPTIMNDIPTFREISDGNPNVCFFHNDARDLSGKLYSLVSGEEVKRNAINSHWMGRYDITTWAKAYEAIL